MTTTQKSPDQIAEIAAKIVLKENGLKREKGEDPLAALGWAMGNGIDYEEALTQIVGRAIELDRAQRKTDPDSPEGDENADRTDLIVSAMQNEDTRNRHREAHGEYENAARDTVRDAVLFALDNGWSATS